jgi:DNA ligase-1
MLYQILAETYEELEKNPSRLAKIDIVANLIREAPDKILPELVLLGRGRVFPPWGMKEMEFGINYLMEAIRKATGSGKKELIQKIKELGDIGRAAEWAVANRKQRLLSVEPLLVEDVVKNLRKISGISGVGTVEKKVNLVAQLFSRTAPLEARYLARTITGELRIGVGEGVIRDAIAKVSEVPSKDLEKAYALTNDFGVLAKMLREKGPDSLKQLRVEIGKPIKVMLAQKTETMKEGLDSFGGTAALEYKYDGFRVQIHKRGKKITLYTRRLEDVTKQFPDIVDAAKKSITAEEVVCEGESIGIDPETKQWLPFQKISRRIKRKYDIEEMVKKIPVVIHLFDLLYLNGKNLMDVPFKERRELLKKIIKPSMRMVLAEQLITDDPKKAKEFYEYSLSLGNEGIMMKNTEAPYQAGSRVGYMLKLKPMMETLDLVIIGAEWGVGRRAGWFGSYILGAYDPDSGVFPEVGRMATGLSDKEFKEMTELLKPLVIDEIGKIVAIKPKVVVEVGYEEIQRSPKYQSGFALRFPRLIGLREDKSPEEADTLERMGSLFSKQRQRR